MFLVSFKVLQFVISYGFSGVPAPAPAKPVKCETVNVRLFPTQTILVQLGLELALQTFPSLIIEEELE